MKKILSVLVALAVVTSFAFAQEAQSTSQAIEPVADGPEMVFEMETVDYGVIEQGSDPYRIFTFSNTGNEPLVIKHAKGSCGCTVPTYPKEPIMPGETGEIKVRYDTNRLGKFTKRVTLTTNVGDEQKVLTIKGEVTKKAEEPAGLPENDSNMFNNNN